MSKLSIIQGTLDSNPDVAVVEKSELFNPIYKKLAKPNFGIHEITLAVSPRRGIYSAEELGKFMDGLLPYLEPDEKGEVREEGNVLYLKPAVYREEIGQEKITRFLTTEDSDLIKRIESARKRPSNFRKLTEGSRTSFESQREYSWGRTITLKVFPDVNIAEDLMNHRLYGYHSLSDGTIGFPREILQKYKNRARRRAQAGQN